MFVLMFLLVLLDIQHPKTPADGIEKQFVATQLVEQTFVDCATNPIGGGSLNNDPLSVNWIKSPEPVTENTSTWMQPGNQPGTTSESMVSTMMVPVNPGGDPNPNPDPNPSCPPVAATPEPSTFAILGITASVLLFLLFGRRQGRRLCRRS